MKKFITSVLAVMAVLSATISCQSIFARRVKVDGNGNLQTRTVTVGNFHEIDASRAVKVIITDGQPGRIEMAAEENLMKYVVVRVQEGELKVSLQDNVSVSMNEPIVVRVPDNGNIRTIEASSAAKVLSEKQLTVNKLEVEASSAAMIRLDVKADACDFDASSAAQIAARIETRRVEAESSSGSTIILQGTAHTASFEASSGAKIEATELTTQLAETEASSGAHIKVYCDGQLDSRTSSGGRVTYSGACSTDSVNTLGSTHRANH
jgi:hypothetical protein